MLHVAVGRAEETSRKPAPQPPVVMARRPRYRNLALRFGAWRSRVECQAFLKLCARPLLALEPVPEERQVRIIKTIAWVCSEGESDGQGHAASPRYVRVQVGGR